MRMRARIQSVVVCVPLFVLIAFTFRPAQNSASSGAEAPTQMPDLKVLVKQLGENQKAIDKIKEDYAGKQVDRGTEYASNGKVTRQWLTESSFFYFDGQKISTITKRGGKLLDAKEEAQETEKAQKRVEEIQKRQAKNDKAQAEGKQEDDQEFSIETFLRICQFKNPRRERFRDRDVLVLDFEGNPTYQPRNLSERIAQKLAGTVWIDEKMHEVARLEAHFTSGAKIGGGLVANIQKGTSLVFEQEYVNNEVWLPVYEETYVDARALPVKGFRARIVTNYSDYRKYQVTTNSVIGSPK